MSFTDTYTHTQIYTLNRERHGIVKSIPVTKMSIVVPQSLDKETREVWRDIESQLNDEREREREKEEDQRERKKARVIVRYRSDSPRSLPLRSRLPPRPFLVRSFVPSNAFYRSRSHWTIFVASFPVMRYIPAKSRASFRGY